MDNNSAAGGLLTDLQHQTPHIVATKTANKNKTKSALKNAISGLSNIPTYQPYSEPKLGEPPNQGTKTVVDCLSPLHSCYNKKGRHPLTTSNHYFGAANAKSHFNYSTSTHPTSTFATQHARLTTIFAMADQDLITYARDAASRGDDLFKLLDVDATSSESDIRRAFRRKALTAHPDKAGDAYDPALYERLEKGRDVLVTPAAREVYDNGMRAILQKKQQLDQMSARRRKLVEELEQREEAAKKPKVDAVQRNAEIEAMAARGRAKMEERKRLIREAEERERQAQEKADAEARAKAAKDTPPAAPNAEPTKAYQDDDDQRIADLERRIREAAQRKAEKKQRKEGKKNGAPPAPEARQSPGRESPPRFPQPPISADHNTPSNDAERASAASSAPLPASHTGGGRSALMAKLKAAQAKRDEAKRVAQEQASA